jgi:hypothetical protein
LTDAQYPLLDNAIDIYCGQLKTMGLAPDTDKSDAETNIGFRYDDEDFYLELDNDDLQNVRFTLAYALSDRQKTDRVRLLETALEITTECTAIATLIDEENDVVFRYDAFVGPELDISPVLTRILDSLQVAQELFFTKLT